MPSEDFSRTLNAAFADGAHQVNRLTDALNISERTLLSRAQVYVLQPLSSDDLKKLIAKVLALPEYQEFTIETDAQKLLVNTADGDARRLLNLLEQLLGAAETRR
ncbi:hypothetical protein MM809_35910, partial [Klebsiella pneumoniae]|nr:hypothetical protein [Klebsiella pneumoniae]